MQTTVAGSYPKIPNRPRPARLRQAIARLDRGEITPEELAQVQDEVTIEVIGEQLEAGLDLIADGQVRWFPRLPARQERSCWRSAWPRTATSRRS